MAMLQILKDNKLLKKKNMFPMGFMRQAVLSKFPVTTEAFYEEKRLDLLKLSAKLEEESKFEKNSVRESEDETYERPRSPTIQRKVEKLVEVRTEIEKNQVALEIIKEKRRLFRSVLNFEANHFIDCLLRQNRHIYNEIGGDYFARFFVEEVLDYMEKEKYKNFIYAGSFCDVLSGDLKVSKDIDIFTTNKYIGDIFHEISFPFFYKSASYYADGCDALIYTFVAYKIHGLNVIVYNAGYEQPDNNMLANFTVNRFNHAVTKHSLIFHEDLNAFLLTEHSVVGKISKLIDVSRDEVINHIIAIDVKNQADVALKNFAYYVQKYNPYPYKHYHNVVDGMVKPNTLFTLCSNYIQNELLGGGIKDVGFIGSPCWTAVNKRCLKYLVENF